VKIQPLRAEVTDRWLDRLLGKSHSEFWCDVSKDEVQFRPCYWCH